VHLAPTARSVDDITNGGGTTMTTVEAKGRDDDYVLGRTEREYERLRAQSRVWGAATERLLDHVAIAPGSRCLDAGCGPAETTRLLAQRVGPSGRVLGVDIDATLGGHAVAMLHSAGHHQCEFARLDVTAGDPVPGAPFDVVYARLLLYHLPERVRVLQSLWDAVAPGGCLVVQDYDLQSVSVQPTLESFAEVGRVIIETFTVAGCEVHTGTRLPDLFAQAGIGAPDGTDVSGRLAPLAETHGMLTAVFTSLLPAAIAHGVTTATEATSTLASFARDAERLPQRPTLWPLMIGAWKRRPEGPHPAANHRGGATVPTRITN
jgi:SAM-dependent methyltransferase